MMEAGFPVVGVMGCQLGLGSICPMSGVDPGSPGSRSQMCQMCPPVKALLDEAPVVMRYHVPIVPRILRPEYWSKEDYWRNKNAPYWYNYHSECNTEQDVRDELCHFLSVRFRVLECKASVPICYGKNGYNRCHSYQPPGHPAYTHQVTTSIRSKSFFFPSGSSGS